MANVLARGDARARILRSAEQLLATSVDGEVSTREICRGAGVSAPTLYHHFADKQVLLDAIVLDGFTRYLTAKRAIAGSSDSREDLRRGWDMHVTFGCEHPSHYRLMFGDPRPGREPPAAQLARQDLARTVAGWERSGRLIVSIEVATSTLHSAAVGVTLQLIALRADATHTISTSVRDVLARALITPSPADEDTVTRVGGPASRLLDVLPHGPLTPLRATEVALLRDWLGAISERPPFPEERSR